MTACGAGENMLQRKRIQDHLQIAQLAFDDSFLAPVRD